MNKNIHKRSKLSDLQWSHDSLKPLRPQALRRGKNSSVEMRGQCEVARC